MLQPAYARLMRALARRAGLRVFRFFRRPLDAPAAALPGLSLRLLGEAELLPVARDPELDLREDGIRAALARGDLCVGALDGETLAGYCWLAFSPVHHLEGIWVRFGPESVWTYKSLVRPSHRGRGIAAALYRFADDLCRQRGRSTSILCVEDHNAPSAAAALRAGYAPSGRAAWLRRGSRLRAWYSRALTPLGVRFFLPR
jgi:GNAT superfamily N-acetyltransferase